MENSNFTAKLPHYCLLLRSLSKKRVLLLLLGIVLCISKKDDNDVCVIPKHYQQNNKSTIDAFVNLFLLFQRETWSVLYRCQSNKKWAKVIVSLALWSGTRASKSPPIATISSRYFSEWFFFNFTYNMSFRDSNNLFNIKGNSSRAG